MSAVQGLEGRSRALLPDLSRRSLSLLGKLPARARDRGVRSWIRRHPLDPAVEQQIVDEVALCWDGVPLPRALPQIVDDARALLLHQLLDSRAASCDGPEHTGKHLRVTSLGRIEEQLAEGRAAVLLTPTFGPWEMIAPALARRGYSVGVLDLRPPGRRPVARQPAAPGLDLQVLPVGGLARPLVRFAVGGPRILVVLGDEGCGVRWGHGALLGRTAGIGATPFELARRTGLGILPVFAVTERGSCRLIIERALKVSDTGRGDADLDTTAGRWLKLVDRYARRHPEHYLPFLHLRRTTGSQDPLPLFAENSPARAAS